jgi:flagellar motor switch protein FliM
MAQGLSQSEIDALLSQTQTTEGDGVEEGSSSSKKEKAVFTYNFRKQKKFNKSHFVLLESIHKRFLRNLEITMTNLLNSPVMSTLAAATELSYTDCMESFSSPTCIYVFNVPVGAGKFVLEIDPNFAFFVIDKILGGSSKEIKTMDRELSLIEEKIMKRVVNFLVKDLMKAWEIVDTLEIEYDAFFAQPDYVQVISATETVILVSMDLRSSEKTLGYMNMSLPSGVLERLLQRYDHSSEERDIEELHDKNDRIDIEYQIRNSRLPMRFILGETQMTLEDLLTLEAGDVIFLPTEVSKPIDVFVGNLNLYKAFPIKKENSVAIKIHEVKRLTGR